MKTDEQSTQAIINFNKLNELLKSVLKKASKGQKQYADQLLKKIVDHLIFQNKSVERVNKKRYGMGDEYNSTFELIVDLIQAMGVTQAELLTIKPEILKFIMVNLSGLKRRLNIDDIMNIKTLYLIYETLEDKKPTNLTDLKEKTKEYATKTRTA